MTERNRSQEVLRNMVMERGRRGQSRYVERGWSRVSRNLTRDLAYVCFLTLAISEFVLTMNNLPQNLAGTAFYSLPPSCP